MPHLPPFGSLCGKYPRRTPGPRGARRSRGCLHRGKALPPTAGGVQLWAGSSGLWLQQRWKCPLLPVCSQTLPPPPCPTACSHASQIRPCSHSWPECPKAGQRGPASSVALDGRGQCRSVAWLHSPRRARVAHGSRKLDVSSCRVWVGRPPRRFLTRQGTPLSITSRPLGRAGAQRGGAFCHRPRGRAVAGAHTTTQQLKPSVQTSEPLSGPGLGLGCCCGSRRLAHPWCTRSVCWRVLTLPCPAPPNRRGAGPTGPASLHRPNSLGPAPLWA